MSLRPIRRTVHRALIVVAFSSALPAWGSAPVTTAPPGERVRQAALATYLHGLTDEIAEREVGPDGVPHLLALLHDPDFPRRDNVVAFLAHLGGDESAGALLRFLESPPAPTSVPEEDRALLLTPVALGRIAARGGTRALDALLGMTAPGREGGILSETASRAGRPSLRDDLLRMALQGLAWAGADAARERLREVRGGEGRPVARGLDLTRAAAAALQLMEQFHPSGPSQGTGPDGASEGTPGAPEVQGAGSASFLPAAGDLDTHARVHDSPLTYANHVDHGSPMTDTRLDAILKEASLRAGRDDYTEDVACCITASRSGTARTFGASGDGLDVINDQNELDAVLFDPIARVKVVRLINYCAGPGTNIIGCSSTPGDGVVVVRISHSGTEAVLWIHEYGHNTGLGHVSDSRNIMHSTDTGANEGLIQTQCDRFHSPSPLARMSPVDTGACTDGDQDAVQDGVDNCPTIANTGQEDADGDGVGDACENLDADGDGIENGADNCPLVPNPDQADSDLDGAGDVCDSDDDNDQVPDATDNCPLTFNPTQDDADGDGLGDACDFCTDGDADGYGRPGSTTCASALPDCDDTKAEVHPGAPEICDGLDDDCDAAVDEARCEDFDANGDGVVDGVELAWVGRSFGLCSPKPALEWWGAVDYTMDRCVEGDDLAILAAVWRCVAPAPLCP